ncbi:MAG: protein kinase [Pirellulaceae bacterium]|nr:protein kinase [Pirellulaceae bacterium]
MELIDNGIQILNRYEITSNLTSGGQAFAYTARDLLCPASRPWEQDVFVKQYHDLPPTAEMLRHIHAMVDLMQQRLTEDSRYICLPIEIGITHNAIVLVFPFVRGRSLQDWMSSTDLTPALRLRFAIALAKAVHCLHRSNLIHLDIKPENVMIQERRDKHFVQLIDLDAARIDGIGMRDRLIGTYGYCSPEHLAPETQGEVGKDSDIFSLGILLNQLLRDVYPFHRDKNYHTSALAENFELPPLTASSTLESLLRSCLSANRVLRPSAQRVGTSLVEFRRSYGDLDLTSPAFEFTKVDSREQEEVVQEEAWNWVPLAAESIAEESVSAPPTADSIIESDSNAEQASALETKAAGRRTTVRFQSIANSTPSFMVNNSQILDVPSRERVSRSSSAPHVYIEIVNEKVFLTKTARREASGLRSWFPPRIALNGRMLEFNRRTPIVNGDQFFYGKACFRVQIDTGKA